jgi:arylsulfatase
MRDDINVLLIMSDQHRADCVGNSAHVSTPNLDALAASGTSFERAYSASALCAPARRTLASGLRPVSHGVLDEKWNRPLRAPTLASILSRRGFHSHIVGKLHVWPSWQALGYKSASQTDWVHPAHDSPYSKYVRAHAGDRKWVEGDHDFDQNSRSVRTWRLNEGLHYTHWCAEEALRFLADAPQGQPFFLTVSFVPPHPPLFPTEELLNKYLGRASAPVQTGDWSARYGRPDGEGRTASFWRGRLPDEEMHLFRSAYYASIEHVDEQIGRILRSVPANTLVLYLSDHGDMLGDHYLFHKRAPYEASTRIPMIIRLPPGLAAPSRKVRDAVELMDIMPTVLDVLKIPLPPHGVDGMSLMPLIVGRPLNRRYIHGENARLPPARSSVHFLTDGRWKYVWFPETATEQLFHIDGDSGETFDLAHDTESSEVVSAMRDLMVQALRGRSRLTDGRRLNI